jgi:adenylate cyclase class 2
VNGGVREVEVKYRVLDPDHITTALPALGLHLSDPVDQDDQAYAEHGWTYGMSKIGVAFARLRTEAGRHLFTLKKPVDNELSCLEYETQVSDRDQMHHAILAMGFTPTVRIVKYRRTARHGDISICLDQVDHAGTFLELERLVTAGESPADAQAELDEFARSLPVALQRTTSTYDTLIRAALAETCGSPVHDSPLSFTVGIQ